MALIYILPKFTQLPPPPNSKTQANFNKLADAFVMALPVFQGELNDFSAAFTSQSTAVLDEINAKNDNMDAALEEFTKLRRDSITDLINQERASIEAINDKGDAILAILDGQSGVAIEDFNQKLKEIIIQYNHDFESMATTVYEKVKDLDSVKGIKDAIVDKVVENKPSLDKLGDAIAQNIITENRLDLSPFKFFKDHDPLTTTNPDQVNRLWLNTASGEIFCCIDATPDQNAWMGTNDTYVGVKARPRPPKLSVNSLS